MNDFISFKIVNIIIAAQLATMAETPELNLPDVTIIVTDDSKPSQETLITKTYEKLISYYTTQYSRSQALIDTGIDSIKTAFTFMVFIIGESLGAIIVVAGIATFIWATLWVAGIIGYLIICGIHNSVGSWIYGPFLSGIVTFLVCGRLCVSCCGHKGHG